MGFQIELDLRNHNKLLLEENEQLQAKVAELEKDLLKTKLDLLTSCGESEELLGRIAELEAENARLNSSPAIEACRQMIRDKAVIEASTLHEQIAAEQLNNKLLRTALEAVIKVHGYESGIPVEAISTPANTEALDAYIKQKIKEYY